MPLSVANRSQTDYFIFWRITIAMLCLVKQKTHACRTFSRVWFFFVLFFSSGFTWFHLVFAVFLYIVSNSIVFIFVVAACISMMIICSAVSLGIVNIFDLLKYTWTWSNNDECVILIAVVAHKIVHRTNRTSIYVLVLIKLFPLSSSVRARSHNKYLVDDLHFYII